MVSSYGIILRELPPVHVPLSPLLERWFEILTGVGNRDQRYLLLNPWDCLAIGPVACSYLLRIPVNDLG